MEYEIQFGVKVDVRIPEEDRIRLYEQWKRWIAGEYKPQVLDKPSLMTRYEHYISHSGCGLHPDPFKPLALQHKGADLEAIIKARRREFPPEKEFMVPAYFVPNIESLVGLKLKDCSLIAEGPDIDSNGRVPIPRIIGVYNNKNRRRLYVGGDIIKQLQLPASRDDLKLKSGTMVREVFDFHGCYRIELVPVPK